MGVDLRKDVARIEAAYNDCRGVTAEFNRNMLRVLNHELGADFDPLAFEHRAFYDRMAHRIEMHLVSARDAAGHDSGHRRVTFAKGESIRTEISTKYDRDERRRSCSRPRTSGSRRGRPIPTTPFGLVVGAPA